MVLHGEAGAYKRRALIQRSTDRQAQVAHAYNLFSQYLVLQQDDLGIRQKYQHEQLHIDLSLRKPRETQTNQTDIVSSIVQEGHGLQWEWGGGQGGRSIHTVPCELQRWNYTCCSMSILPKSAWHSQSHLQAKVPTTNAAVK